MNIALILSGGTGSRMGMDIPKQYAEVNGKLIIEYCTETFLKHKEIDAVWIVADVMWQDFIIEKLSQGNMSEEFSKKFRGFSMPGATRQLSILNGLQDLMKWADDRDYVMIHDAARPLLTEELISKCFEAVKDHEGVLPVLPMKDTVYLSSTGEKVDSLLSRSKLFAGQAPEVFLLGKYYRANKELAEDALLKINGSTEPAILAGMDIAMISGDEHNFKITTKLDLERFEHESIRITGNR